MSSGRPLLHSRPRSRSPRRQGASGCKLHISNLPTSYPQKSLHEVFSRFGKIEDVRIIRKGGNGQPLKESVYGFVVMSREEEAQRAMEELSSAGWSVTLSKETQERQSKIKDGLLEPPVESHAMPNLQAFQHNVQATQIMLLNNANPTPGQPMDRRLLERLIAENHPSAFNMSGIPPLFQSYFLVREVWIGNISPATEKKALYDAFKVYGEIEGIEMFSSKGFAFIKYRKVVSATRAYELAQGVLVDERPVKVAFADPTRRIDILGDSSAPEDPNFNPIDDDNFKNLYLGYNNGAVVPPESKLREIFSRYGVVKGIHIKQASGNVRPYAFVDFEKGEQAALARRHLYIEDKDGRRRVELGDRALEISFKNTNSIVSRSGVKNGVRFHEHVGKQDAQEVAKRLMQKPPEFLSMISYPSGMIPPPPPPGGFQTNPIPILSPASYMHSSTYPTPPITSPPSTTIPLPTPTTTRSPPQASPEEDPNIGNVVWSGFMTRSKSHRVGIDATLVKGSADSFGNIHHLNITHRVQQEDAWKNKIQGLITLEASNETQQNEFNDYIAYFVKKQRAGFIPLKPNVLYILPPTEIALRLYPKINQSQLLGVFADPTKRAEKPPSPPVVNEQLAKLLSDIEKIKQVSVSNVPSGASVADPRLLRRMNNS